MRLPHERFDYSAIVDRKPWKLPKGARIAVWTIVNIEEWDFERPMARQYLTAPQGVQTVPDVPNWAWHDYGMRVGFWRLFEALGKRKLRATTSINANVCRSYERVARAMLDAGWEFMGHGVKQGAMHTLSDQRAAIRESVQIIREFTGKAPRGWLGPGLTETWETLDLLREEGIEYVSDWVNDDQPYEIRTTAGPLVSVPYTLELNDIPVMVIQHHESAAWVQRCRDQFDRLYASKYAPKDYAERVRKTVGMLKARYGLANRRRIGEEERTDDIQDSASGVRATRRLRGEVKERSAAPSGAGENSQAAFSWRISSS